ncbi:MAG: flavodoxin [Hyphomicrobiales bacterium]
MKKVGIFYGSTYGATESVAEKIHNELGVKNADVINIKDAKVEDIEKYDNLIFGTSAWGIGGMQDDWERFISNIEDIDFDKKRLALFGLGDQDEFPESFVDALGTLYCRLPNKKVVVGKWPATGYKYYFSIAENNGQFVGLVIDEHAQSDKTDARIKKWVSQLKKELLS